MKLLGSKPVAGSSLNSALECNRFMLEQTFFEGRVYFGGNDHTMTILSSLFSLKHLCYVHFKVYVKIHSSYPPLYLVYTSVHLLLGYNEY